MAQQYLTVTALTKYLKRKFDADPYLERVYLTGEISNFRRRPNHQYFSSKRRWRKNFDSHVQGSFDKLRFQPEEGMKVLAVGRISLYEASGNYQMYIEHMEPDGVGALYQAYEQLKKKLAEEGLFSAPKKSFHDFQNESRYYKPQWRSDSGYYHHCAAALSDCRNRLASNRSPRRQGSR